MSAPRTNFGKAPVGYRAGAGRGAVGFTTRSDIGPAQKAAAAAGDAPPGFAGRGGPAPKETPKEASLDDSVYDEFSGYSENLFAGLSYDREDEEADRIYDAVDNRMDSKRKSRREKILEEEMKTYRKKRPKIAEQFRDIKKTMTTLDAAAWESIPEALDMSQKNKTTNKRQDIYTPVPDNILTMGQGAGQANQLDSRQMAYGGMETPLGLMTPISGPADLTQLGRARDKVLSLELDRRADSVAGQTVVDPKGYLTDLNSIKVSNEAEVSDIKKGRLLLKSVITTNPKHAPGWLAAARLENETGKLATARAIIMKACEVCPTSEDVWLEASILATKKNARAILAKAVQHIPNAVNIWMRACDLEEDPDAKKAVLRRALELVPNSVRLWKAAIELEDQEDARIMLGRAVELVPMAVEMWLALARLETYENARVVLNRARKTIPTEPSIWITAAKLEEANGNSQVHFLLIEFHANFTAASDNFDYVICSDEDLPRLLPEC